MVEMFGVCLTGWNQILHQGTSVLKSIYLVQGMAQVEKQLFIHVLFTNRVDICLHKILNDSWIWDNQAQGQVLLETRFKALESNPLLL